MSTRRLTYAQLIERDRLAGERERAREPKQGRVVSRLLDPDRDYKAEYNKLYQEWVRAEAKLERAKFVLSEARRHRNTLYAQMKRSELALVQQNRR